MAYKNSFCKTGKSKSGLSMNRSPLGAHCFKKLSTPAQFNKTLETKAKAGDFDDNPNFKKVNYLKSLQKLLWITKANQLTTKTVY